MEEVQKTTEPPAQVRAEWRAIVAPYQHPNTRKSIVQVTVTLVALFATFAAMYFGVHVHPLVPVALGLVAAGLLVRSFIIMHDCGHGSFFRSRRANSIVGFITGTLTLTPFAQWARDHAIHHATSGNLDKRGYGDIDTLTVKEYLALAPMARLRYRLYRNPAILLGLGPLWLIVKQRFHTPGSAGRREIVGVHLTNAVAAALFVGFSLLVGPIPVLAIYGPTMLLAGAAGIALFYVQHQYEQGYWVREDTWDYAAAAIEGSSLVRLPRWLDWMTASIGFHHIHHLSPRIPNYNLHRAHDENPYFHRAHLMTLGEGIRTFSLKLWDEEQHRMIGWRELRERLR